MLDFYKEYVFNLSGKKFHARAWGNPEASPVMALHGWLDNANSFTPLAEHLEDVFLVAPDLAGHGLTDHRSADARYNIWQDTTDIFAIADQLDWKNFSLLGHSRGGICATISAGTFPRRISRLILLDALIPVDIATQDSAPKQLAKAMLSLRRLDNSKKTIYPSPDKALGPRMRSPMTLSHKSANLLAERGLEEVDGGYRWRTDPQLTGASEVRLVEDQYAAFLDAINCPSLMLIAEQGRMKQPLENVFNRLLADNALFEKRILPGGHHFHMEDETVSEVAEAINSFLKN